ncbi:hypothetical protein [Streptomyces tagetis]|uniref:Uncharacterized protein n=1 Tax=Streptomyces tagetis TaxID=2820809 RepID=A0A940XFV6_9ACTN|nr:hypothetical protein [Streptomyces sp. RG38]MBQ0827719.1 hypothetical protein [Streptomyces sp. RG38]
MLPDITWKSSDTDRTTATLADDPELTTQLAGNGIFHARFYLLFGATNTGRFRTVWKVPSGASGLRSALGPDQGTVLSSGSSGGPGRWGAHVFSTACIYGVRDGTGLLAVAIEESILTTSVAGTLAIQWAQQTTNATATRLGAGSYLEVRRLA